MELNTLLCLIEIIGTVIIVVTVAVIAKWKSIKQALERMRETTQAATPTWKLLLAAFLGANLGFLVLAGIISLVTWMENPSTSEAFFIPATVAVYLLCAIPLYLPLAVICTLLVERFARRKGMGSRAAIIMVSAISIISGAVLGVPVYLVGLMGAAI